MSDIILLKKNNPIIIFALMFIFCVVIIRAKIPNNKASPPQKKLKQSQAYALLSLISLTFTCFILFKTEYKKSIYIIIPTITTMALSILTIRSYLTSVDNKKTLYLYTKKMIKYTWIIISLCGYNISRAIVSTTFDIPFDITYNRPTTFITSLIFIF